MSPLVFEITRVDCIQYVYFSFIPFLKSPVTTVFVVILSKLNLPCIRYVLLIHAYFSVVPFLKSPATNMFVAILSKLNLPCIGYALLIYAYFSVVPFLTSPATNIFVAILSKLNLPCQLRVFSSNNNLVLYYLPKNTRIRHRNRNLRMRS